MLVGIAWAAIIIHRVLRSHSFGDIHIGSYKPDIDQLDHREELVGHSFDRRH